MSSSTQNRYRLGDAVARQVAAMRKKGYDLTLDIDDGVTCIIWSPHDEVQMQGEVAKHHSTTVEAAIKGAFKKWSKKK